MKLESEIRSTSGEEDSSVLTRIWKLGAQNCPNVVKSLGVLFFKGVHIVYSLQPKTCIYLLKLRHTILIQFHGIEIGVKKIQLYLYEKDILRNCLQNKFDVLRSAFWVSK